MYVLSILHTEVPNKPAAAVIVYTILPVAPSTAYIDPMELEVKTSPLKATGLELAPGMLVFHAMFGEVGAGPAQ